MSRTVEIIQREVNPEILNGLPEIKSKLDLLKFKNISGGNLFLKHFKNDGKDYYIINYNGKDVAFIEGKQRLEQITKVMEKFMNVDIQYKLEKQQAKIQTRQELNTHENEVRLSSKGFDKLVELYNSGKYPKKQILDLISQKILAASFAERINFLKQIKNDGELYYFSIGNVLRTVRGNKEADVLIKVVGKEDIQKAVQDYIIITPNFADSYRSYYKDPNFKVNCSGDVQVSGDDCRSFMSYVYALQDQTKGIFDVSAVAYLLSKSFDSKLSDFAKKINEGIEKYVDLGNKMPAVYTGILQKYGIMGLLDAMLSKGSMSEKDKQLWMGLGQIGIVVGAIWGIFKFISKNGLKGLLGIIAGDFASDYFTGDHLWTLAEKVMYGGFDIDEITKKISAKGIEKGKEKSNYKKLIGGPTFVNTILGNKKLGKLPIGFSNGKLKFDAKKYIDNLPDSDWTKALLLKMGYKKVAKIVEDSLSQMGIRTEEDWRKYHDKKISLIYSEYLVNLEKISSTNHKVVTNDNGSVFSSNVSSASNIESNAPNVKKGLMNNKVDNIINKGHEVSYPSNVNIADHYPVKLDINTAKIYEFTSEELQKKVGESLKEKLGLELYNKLNKYIKVLKNLEYFSIYLMAYAAGNKYQDRFFNFTALTHILDRNDMFMDESVKTFKYQARSYSMLIRSLLVLAIHGDKNQLNRLINQISINKQLDGFLKLVNSLESLKGISKFDDPGEIAQIKKIVESGDRSNISEYFAENLSDPDFLFSYVSNNVIFSVSGKKFQGFVESLVNDSSENAITKIKNMLPNFKIFGKNIVGLKIDSVKMYNFLNKVTYESRGMSQKERISYVYSMVINKILEDNKDLILKQLQGKNKKIMEKFYSYHGMLYKLKNHWASYFYKTAMITSAIFLTDGAIGAILPETGGLVVGATRLLLNTVAMQNISGDMSLWLNDQLNLHNALEIATDFKGYMHTAAYMGVLEAIGFLSGKISKLEGIKKISGSLEKIGKGSFNMKKVALYGVNVGGIVFVDTIVFNGKFTAEELMNALVFAALMKGGKGEKKVEVDKAPDGKIKIKIWDKIKGKFIKTKPDSKKSTAKSELLSPDDKLMFELEKYEKTLKSKLNKLKIELKTATGDEKNKINDKIKKIEDKLKIIDNGDFDKLPKSTKARQIWEELKTSKSESKDVVDKKILAYIEKKGSIELDNYNINYKNGKYWVDDGTYIKDLTKKEFKKFLSENPKLSEKLGEEYINESVIEKYTDKNLYKKEIFDGYKLGKTTKIGDKEYVSLEKNGKYYMVEKTKDGYNKKSLKPIDEFIKDHPEVVEQYKKEMIKLTAKISNVMGSIFKKYESKKVSDLPKEEQSKIVKILGKSFSWLKDKTFKDVVENFNKGKEIFKNDTLFNKGVDLFWLPLKRGLTGKVDAGFLDGTWRFTKGILFLGAIYSLNEGTKLYLETGNLGDSVVGGFVEGGKDTVIGLEKLVNFWNDPKNAGEFLLEYIGWTKFFAPMFVAESSKDAYDYYNEKKNKKPIGVNITNNN